MRYSCFQIGCVIIEYVLLRAKTFIQNLTYVRFGIILTQVYVNFSRQEHQMSYRYRSKPEILRFHLNFECLISISNMKIFKLRSMLDPSIKVIPAGHDHHGILKRNLINP